jgi:hypothetical protein
MTKQAKSVYKRGLLGWLLLASAVAFSMLAAVEPASACSVCNGIQEEASRKAFVGTTALLTFLPLILVGIVVSIFVRRTLERERQEERQRPDSVQAQRVA